MRNAYACSAIIIWRTRRWMSRKAMRIRCSTRRDSHALQGDAMSAMNDSGRSLAYATNNHPVIREKISNAVLGILWYLILLVPFVFFFEKLLFGFTDIRKQLLAHGVIFVCRLPAVAGLPSGLPHGALVADDPARIPHLPALRHRHADGQRALPTDHQSAAQA